MEKGKLLAMTSSILPCKVGHTGALAVGLAASTLVDLCLPRRSPPFPPPRWEFQGEFAREAAPEPQLRFLQQRC